MLEDQIADSCNDRGSQEAGKPAFSGKTLCHGNRIEAMVILTVTVLGVSWHDSVILLFYI